MNAQPPKLVFSLCLLALVLPVSAQDNPPSNNSQAASTQQDVGARKARNPLADKISVALDNGFSFDSGPLGGTAYALEASVVAPSSLGDNWLLLHKVTLRLLRDPENVPGQGGKLGLGDSSYQGLVTRNRNSRIIWGVGPAFVIPTATSSRLGSGKWSAGPAAGFVGQPGHWTFGVLGFNTWSYAGDSARQSVNQLTLEPFVSYDLKDGWFVSSQPEISADWTAPRGARWTVPMGGGGGKGFTSGERSVFVTMFGYYNIAHPPGSSPWQLSIGLEFLFGR